MAKKRKKQTDAIASATQEVEVQADQIAGEQQAGSEETTSVAVEAENVSDTVEDVSSEPEFASIVANDKSDATPSADEEFSEQSVQYVADPELTDTQDGYPADIDYGLTERLNPEEQIERDFDVSGVITVEAVAESATEPVVNIIVDESATNAVQAEPVMNVVDVEFEVITGNSETPEQFDAAVAAQLEENTQSDTIAQREREDQEAELTAEEFDAAVGEKLEQREEQKTEPELKFADEEVIPSRAPLVSEQPKAARVLRVVGISESFRSAASALISAANAVCLHLEAEEVTALEPVLAEFSAEFDKLTPAVTDVSLSTSNGRSTLRGRTTNHDLMKSVEIFGVAATSVLRWLGRDGFTNEEAAKALDSFGIHPNSGTIRVSIKAGAEANGDTSSKGPIPQLKPELIEKLREFKAKKESKAAEESAAA